MDTNTHEWQTAETRRRGERSGFLQKDDPGQRNGAFALRQLIRFAGISSDPVVSSKLIQGASTRREIQRDRLFAFEGCKVFATASYFGSVSDPDFVSDWIEFVAQAKRQDFITAVEKKVSIILTLLVRCVRSEEISEGVVASDCVVWHGGKMA